MLPDDDKRYAIETCRSSESVLKKWFKINDIQLVHLLVVWYLVNLQNARCNNKDKWRQVNWYTGKNILEGSAASIFRVEDGYSRFLQNVAPFYCTTWCQIPENWKRESIIAFIQFITANNVNTVKTSTLKYCMYELWGHIQPRTLQ